MRTLNVKTGHYDGKKEYGSDQDGQAGRAVQRQTSGRKVCRRVQRRKAARS